MADLIDRQAVIEAVVAWTVEDRPDIEMPTDLVGRIESLPSAQPEIIRCKDCKKNPHWEWVGCPMTGKDTRKPEDYCSYAERRTDG